MWAILNRKWRQITMMEIKKMALSDLENIISTVDFTEAEVSVIWKVKRGAFEVF